MEEPVLDAECIVCYNIAYCPISCSKCGKLVCVRCFSQLPLTKKCPQRCHDDKRVWQINNDVRKWLETHEAESVATLTATPQFWFAMMYTFHPLKKFGYNEMFLNDKRASGVLRRVYDFTCQKQPEEKLPAFLKEKIQLDVWCVKGPSECVITPFSCFSLGEFTFVVPFNRFVAELAQKIFVVNKS